MHLCVQVCVSVCVVLHMHVGVEIVMKDRKLQIQGKPYVKSQRKESLHVFVIIDC